MLKTSLPNKILTKHLDECTLIKSKTFPNKTPTTYNSFWNSKQQLVASSEELKEQNIFFSEIREAFCQAEERGDIVVSNTIKFPTVEGIIYEPDNLEWICPPIFCQIS